MQYANASALLITSESRRRLGASPDHLARLYCERPAFRALWDDYVVCRLGLLHWETNTGEEAGLRRLEYAQSLQELEQEIRKHIERSWDLVEEAVAPIVFGSASEILRELRAQHGLRGREVYLAPLFPLIEMAWLGQRPDADTIGFIQDCGRYICQRLGQIAGGHDVLDEAQLHAFVSRFLRCETQPLDRARLSRLGLNYLRAHSNPVLVRARERAIWRCCYLVANKSRTHKPSPAQLALLKELAPEHTHAWDVHALAQTGITELLADLEEAWACA